MFNLNKKLRKFVADINAKAIQPKASLKSIKSLVKEFAIVHNLDTTEISKRYNICDFRKKATWRALYQHMVFRVSGIEIKDYSYEIAVLVAENGSIQMISQRKKGEVVWSGILQEPGQKYLAMHNHPNGFTLSMTDLRFMYYQYNFGIVRLGAITPEGIEFDFALDAAITPSQLADVEAVHSNFRDSIRDNWIATRGYATNEREDYIACWHITNDTWVETLKYISIPQLSYSHYRVV